MQQSLLLALPTCLEMHLYKWKNHFNEMKGDVGMSSHEKEREQEDVYIHQDRKSLITPSLHLCFAQNCCFFIYGYAEGRKP